MRNRPVSLVHRINDWMKAMPFCGSQLRYLLAILFVLGLLSTTPLQAEKVLVEVNGTKITQEQVDFACKTQGVAAAEWEQQTPNVLEQLIDKTLIQDLLDSRNVQAPQATLDRQLALIQQVLKNETDPEQTLARLGMTREDLQKQLALPLAWQRYIRQIVTEAEIKDYFEKHRQELDGTKRQVSQIFLKPESTSDQAVSGQKLAELTSLRDRILAKEMTFATAARQYSQSPSAEKGGDIGTFTFAGQMPATLARQAFTTPVGEMSQPFASPFGYHLLFVSREIPGQFSLEDARREILLRLADELWEINVARLRKTARIQYRN